MTLTEPMATVLVGVFAALAGVVTYACTEHSKLKQEDYVRREERYRLLITNAAGFRVDRENAPQKESFLRELDQCWLYCPDEVIMAAYAFLDTVRVGSSSSAVERDVAYGRFMLAIRRDLLSRRRVTATELQSSDYKLLRATEKPSP